MEVLFIILLILGIFVVGPVIVPFFLPNIDGFGGCASLIIALLLALLWGWWGIFIYLVLYLILKKTRI